MINNEHKILIDSYLNSAILIDNGFITPRDSFDKYIRKIKDLKLSKNIPSNEVADYIKQKLIDRNCPITSIQQFFNWSIL